MLVSMIIPTYNRSSKICEAVECALAQTYKNKEVIVVDDGSTDDTLEVLKRFGSSIRVVSQENGGPSVARNRGVAESKGQIIAFLDSDDLWMPDKTERQVSLLARAGHRMCLCICNGWVDAVDGKWDGESFDVSGIKVPMGEGEWSNPGEVLATTFLLFNQAVAIRREVFDAVGGFNPELRILEDYELAMKLSSRGTWGIISEPLVVKRNDTLGIGVSCMKDRLQHTQMCVDTLERILMTPMGLNERTAYELRRALGLLRLALEAERVAANDNPFLQVAGRVAARLIRMWRGVRRRSPSWPQVQATPL